MAERPRDGTRGRRARFHSAIRGRSTRSGSGRSLSMAQCGAMDDRGRRDFLTSAFTAGVAAALGRPLSAAAAGPAVRRRMTIDLICGNLGVKATQREAIDLARRHGFESVFPDAAELARLEGPELDRLRADLEASGLV